MGTEMLVMSPSLNFLYSVNVGTCGAALCTNVPLNPMMGWVGSQLVLVFDFGSTWNLIGSGKIYPRFMPQTATAFVPGLHCMLIIRSNHIHFYSRSKLGKPLALPCRPPTFRMTEVYQYRRPDTT
jgi:hypothetical protein